jgi:hypothetical protein
MIEVAMVTGILHDVGKLIVPADLATDTRHLFMIIKDIRLEAGQKQ